MVIALLVVLTQAQSPDDQFFEQRIRPVLVEKCYSCHSAQAEKLKGDLRLDTRENLLKGGKDGDKVIKVVEPGNPEKSMIIEAIGYKNEDMPRIAEALKSSGFANTDVEGILGGNWIRFFTQHLPK